MNLTISDAAKQAYPTLKVAIVEVIFDQKPQFNEDMMEFKKELETAVRENGSTPEMLERVAKYNEFYKRFGSKVPMEFQIKSVIGGKAIPVVDPIHTCMFIAELKNVILTAGHDRTTLGDSIEVLLALGSEEYTCINEKQQVLKPNDIYAFDSQSIISSVLSGPDARTKLREETTHCLFMCYAFDMTEDELRQHLNDILHYLGAEGRIIVA